MSRQKSGTGRNLLDFLAPSPSHQEVRIAAPFVTQAVLMGTVMISAGRNLSRSLVLTNMSSQKCLFPLQKKRKAKKTQLGISLTSSIALGFLEHSLPRSLSCFPRKHPQVGDPAASRAAQNNSLKIVTFSSCNKPYSS